VERFGPAREYSIHMLLEGSAMRGDVRMECVPRANPCVQRAEPCEALCTPVL